MRALLLGLLVLAGCAAPGPSREAVGQLAPTGALRVAVLTSNPVIAKTTPPIARELAQAAGVPAKLIEYPAVGPLMKDATTGAWDVSVVAVDPGRASIVDFMPAHLASDAFLTVLVPPGSAARRMADVDRPGARIAAVTGAATILILDRTLKNAKTIAAPNEDAAFALMKEGKADGYAQNRFILRARAATLPGSRILDDAFAGLDLAFVLPKGRPAASEAVAKFIEQAKASGLVQKAIDEAGMGADVKVAPAGR